MLLALLLGQGTAGPATHDTSGALTGPGAVVAGSANRTREHDATGALSGPGAVVAGSAARTRAHATDGALSGPGSTVTGDAARSTEKVEVSWLEIEAGVASHDTSGALTGPGAAVTGDAARTRQHATDGALQGPGSTLAGSAARTRAHPTSGDLTGPGAVLAGSANRFRAHATDGVLNGPGAVITGDAQRSGSATVHDTSGALVGSGAVVAGEASRTSAVGPVERGDGVDPRWTKKQRRERDRKLDDERLRKDELRQLLKRALDPVSEEAAVEVVTVDDGVVVIPATGQPVAMPLPEGIDLRAMSREIGKILADAKVQAERTRRVRAQEIARAALEQARENERLRIVMRKRQQDEFLLLMT